MTARSIILNICAATCCPGGVTTVSSAPHTHLTGPPPDATADGSLAFAVVLPAVVLLSVKFAAGMAGASPTAAAAAAGNAPGIVPFDVAFAGVVPSAAAPAGTVALPAAGAVALSAAAAGAACEAGIGSGSAAQTFLFSGIAGAC